MAAPPKITLYFLQGSRAIRIAWLLEELGLSYSVVFADRTKQGLGPSEFKAQIGTKLARSPVIKDGDLTIQESIAIAEYLCEKYDSKQRLIPKSYPERARAKEWIVASEGTFLIHALPMVYLKRALPGSEHETLIEEVRPKMTAAVRGDFDWLEEELEKVGGKYLTGDELTAADIMIHFSVQFIFARNLGTEGGSWPNVEKWLKALEQEESYKRAVQKTGYKL